MRLLFNSIRRCVTFHSFTYVHRLHADHCQFPELSIQTVKWPRLYKASDSSRTYVNDLHIWVLRVRTGHTTNGSDTCEYTFSRYKK